MPPRQKSLTRGRWSSIALSLLLHGCIIAAAVFGWFTWKHKPPPLETMAIEATIVDAKTLGAPPTPQPQPPAPEPVPEPEPEPEPEPPPPEEQGPPKPDPAEVEKKLEQERLEAEKLEQERLDTEKKEAERVAAAQKKAAADKAAAEKKAAEKKKADELAAKKAADEKARQDELRRSLEAEERGNAMRNSAEAARWHRSIVAKIERAWRKPASAQPGIECIVAVTQILGPQGGEVVAVKVNSCNGGDAALRESIETAVLSASPLPPPPDPALFERNLELTFAPTS